MTPPLSRGFVSSPILQPDATEALLAAALAGNSVTARRLLVQGADPDATDAQGFSALHLACYYGHVEVVHVLVQFGASINQPAGEQSMQNHEAVPADRKSGWNLSPLIISAACGHLGLVEYLVENQADVTAAAEGGVTPLIAAASLGRTAIVQYLVKAGTPLEHRRFDGATALVLAAAAGHLDILRLLHASGAQMDPPCNPPIIHRAAVNGFPEVVRYLLWNGVQYDKYDSHGATALCLAATVGHLNVVRELSHFGISPNDLRCQDGTTALHCAARAGHLPMVSFLVGKRACLHHSDVNGIRPLHAAVQGGNVEVVRFLLTSCIGQDMGATRASAPLLRMALQVITRAAGLDMCHETTLLHVACHHGHLQVAQFLLSLKVDINMVDSLGCTALRVACDEGHTAVARLLVASGADVNRADHSDVSPLMSACHYGREAIVRMLVAAGCELQCHDQQGLTALHHAALKGHTAIMRYLTKQITPCALTLEHWDDALSPGAPSPLALAANANNLDFVLHLLQANVSL